MKNKRHVWAVILILLMFVFMLTCCDKAEIYEDSPKTEIVDETDNNDSDSSDDSSNDDSSNDDSDSYDFGYCTDTMTVKQFITGDYNGLPVVEGYIIGDCTRRFKYAEFEPPFTCRQALLLADNMSERDPSNIMSVQLKRGPMREELNLVDNPQWYGKKVVFCGYSTIYLGLVGMKEVVAYPRADD